MVTRKFYAFTPAVAYQRAMIKQGYIAVLEVSDGYNSNIYTVRSWR